MTEFQLLQTEKSYLVQKHNYYLIQFADKRFEPNKIEVMKLLKKEGYNPLTIKVANQYKKLKRRGKQSNLISIKRPKKYYVKLKQGESIKFPEDNNANNVTK
ncbi:50S ribosomal protein L23 [Candidatus Gracilibacteria bacterium]|nr:50S ribosomal protein L23 [Candidatus Gracilibacteria bacterium]NJS41569.1 50S ribosomal protein L23 [Candidatus Gracilibacteria bacterium]